MTIGNVVAILIAAALVGTIYYFYKRGAFSDGGSSGGTGSGGAGGGPGSGNGRQQRK